MDYNKLKHLVKEKGLTLAKLSESIAMTETGFHQAVKKETLTIKKLEKIAEVLNVNAAYFFDESTDIKAASMKTYGECPSCEKLKDEIVNLKKIIELQDKLLNK